MLSRNATRVVLDGVEITASLSQPDGPNVAFNLTTTSELLFGFYGKFTSRYIQIHTANNQTSEMSVQYWNGTAWADVDDFFDETSVGGKTLAQSGFLSWVNKTDWKPKAVTGVDSDVELYWIKVAVDSNLGASTKIHAVLNLFSNDSLLGSYFPELISDTNYFPSGKTNFLNQHMAAKDLVVLRLKQRKLINNESQILDPNDVSLAAVYACAKIILQPIATSPDSKDLLLAASVGFDEEISKVNFPVDSNQDGVVSEYESVQNLSVNVVRR